MSAASMRRRCAKRVIGDLADYDVRHHIVVLRVSGAVFAT
jgi:hypothetical protein